MIGSYDNIKFNFAKDFKDVQFLYLIDANTFVLNTFSKDYLDGT